MNNFGKNIRISIFGESHGKYIGLTIDGLPTNFTFDEEKIKNQLLLRKGDPNISTLRREPDSFHFVSGYFNNHTTGAPLTILVDNLDIDNKPYENFGIIRPSHADYTYYIKYQGAHDYLGGGYASGRMTVVLVILGEMCRQILATKQIMVVSHIASLKNIDDLKIDNQYITYERLKPLLSDSFPVLDPQARIAMLNLIEKTAKTNDGLGGTIETYAFNVPVGLGEPFFNSFESVLSHLLFSIPGVKGVEFGDGFNITKKASSYTIDELSYVGNKVNFSNNHQGGINAGITNGNVILFKVAVRGPSSINKPLNSINVRKKENITVTTDGRHDVTFVHRVVPIINALTYFTILDFMYENDK